jgi:hypothetical protein
MTAFTISGARNTSGSRYVTYRSVSLSRFATSVAELALPAMIASNHLKASTNRLSQRRVRFLRTTIIANDQFHFDAAAFHLYRCMAFDSDGRCIRKCHDHLYTLVGETDRFHQFDRNGNVRCSFSRWLSQRLRPTKKLTTAYRK